MRLGPNEAYPKKRLTIEPPVISAVMIQLQKKSHYVYRDILMGTMMTHIRLHVFMAYSTPTKVIDLNVTERVAFALTYIVRIDTLLSLCLSLDAIPMDFQLSPGLHMMHNI